MNTMFDGLGRLWLWGIFKSIEIISGTMLDFHNNRNMLFEDKLKEYREKKI